MPDLELLLAPTGSMPPCGIDLEYDPAFLELAALASGKPERQFETAADEPPWREVMDRAAAQLGRSKDLRLALIHARAATHVAGLAGFHTGLRLLLGLLERYWDGLYPPLDIEDGNDPALRVNALAALADPYTPFDDHSTLLHDLRSAEVCRTRGERLTVRDILIAQGRLAAPEGASGMTLQFVQGVLGAALAQDANALIDALALPQVVEALANRMTERFGAENAPSLTMMMGIAQSVASAGRVALAQAEAEAQAKAAEAQAVAEAEAEAQAVAKAEAEAGTDAEAEAKPSDAQTAAKAEMAQREPPVETGQRVEPAPICCGGALATREDAIRLLESVCAFIERTEPTNPAPLLIRRARALMDKDFIAIMQDLAPDGLAQLRLIAGTREE